MCQNVNLFGLLLYYLLTKVFSKIHKKIKSLGSHVLKINPYVKQLFFKIYGNLSVQM